MAAPATTRIEGNGQSDDLDGDTGNDTLNGGPGDPDNMNGGPGADLAFAKKKDTLTSIESVL